MAVGSDDWRVPSLFRSRNSRRPAIAASPESRLPSPSASSNTEPETEPRPGGGGGGAWGALPKLRRVTYWPAARVTPWYAPAGVVALMPAGMTSHTRYSPAGSWNR